MPYLDVESVWPQLGHLYLSQQPSEHSPDINSIGMPDSSIRSHRSVPRLFFRANELTHGFAALQNNLHLHHIAAVPPRVLHCRDLAVDQVHNVEARRHAVILVEALAVRVASRVVLEVARRPVALVCRIAETTVAIGPRSVSGLSRGPPA